MLENFYYITNSFKLSYLLYLVSSLFYLLVLFRKEPFIRMAALWLFAAGFAAVSYFLVERWIAAGRPPFKSLYESLVFAAWSISLINLIVEFKYKIRFLGNLTSWGVLAVLSYALSRRDIEIVPLPPALQTWVFIPHVVAYFMAYGAIFITAMTAVLTLIFPQGIKGHRLVSDETHISFGTYTYLIAKFGFLLLTLGLLMGAWWGQEAWSSYWAWDPKENWALISWLIFVVYLHLRYIDNCTERQLSWVVIGGFLAIVFTYLGMSLLPTAESSMHVYQ